MRLRYTFALVGVRVRLHYTFAIRTWTIWMLRCGARLESPRRSGHCGNVAMCSCFSHCFRRLLGRNACSCLLFPDCSTRSTLVPVFNSARPDRLHGSGSLRAGLRRSMRVLSLLCVSRLLSKFRIAVAAASEVDEDVTVTQSKIVLCYKLQSILNTAASELSCRTGFTRTHVNVAGCIRNQSFGAIGRKIASEAAAICLQPAVAGPAASGICQTGCNTVYMASSKIFTEIDNIIRFVSVSPRQIRCSRLYESFSECWQSKILVRGVVSCAC